MKWFRGDCPVQGGAFSWARIEWEIFRVEPNTPFRIAERNSSSQIPQDRFGESGAGDSTWWSSRPWCGSSPSTRPTSCARPAGAPSASVRPSRCACTSSCTGTRSRPRLWPWPPEGSGRASLVDGEVPPEDSLAGSGEVEFFLELARRVVDSTSVLDLYRCDPARRDRARRQPADVPGSPGRARAILLPAWSLATRDIAVTTRVPSQMPLF